LALADPGMGGPGGRPPSYWPKVGAGRGCAKLSASEAGASYPGNSFKDGMAVYKTMIVYLLCTNAFHRFNMLFVLI